MSGSQPGRYWQRTSGLMWSMFALWLFFSFFVHFFATSLNSIVIFGFPLGFYMAAQGSLAVFVVLLLVFSRKQDSIDRDEGAAEPD